jgi:hypothetical protein
MLWVYRYRPAIAQGSGKVMELSMGWELSIIKDSTATPTNDKYQIYPIRENQGCKDQRLGNAQMQENHVLCACPRNHGICLTFSGAFCVAHGNNAKGLS